MFRFLLIFLCFLFNPLGQASEIALLTFPSEESSLAIENKQHYCALHKYDLLIHDNSSNKVETLFAELKNGSHRWIVWMNPDTLIMNMDVPLEDLIDEKFNLLISEDSNGVNSGVFFIKNCSWSAHFINQNGFLTLDTLIQDPFVKIVPQRLFNSYPENLALGTLTENTALAILKCEFQKGDFIINLTDVHDKASLMEHYANQIVNDRNLITLDQYHSYFGFKFVPGFNFYEGYMSDAQKLQFQQRLKQHPRIKKIAEIGLNGGHSAENFFQSIPHLQKFLSFDLNYHPYCSVAVEYLSRKYKDRFVFAAGDSQLSVPAYTVKHPKEKFDLIYIDGGHTFENCLHDIQNCRRLAKPGHTILWIDDYCEGNDVQKAVSFCESNGLIRILGIYQCTDHTGLRSWIEAIYQKI